MLDAHAPEQQGWAPADGGVDAPVCWSTGLPACCSAMIGGVSLIVAVCNQKGGVGKTTSTLALASAAVVAGMRVLVVDLDPQANASQSLGVGDRAEDPEALSAYDVLAANIAGGAGGAVVESAWPGVAVLPADQALSAAETSATPADALARSLDGATGEVDLVLVDCPPSVGRLTLNALVAADLALVITSPGAYASEGVVKIAESITTVQRDYNPALTLAGIIVTMMPPRGREATLRLAELGEQFPDLVWAPPIPRRAVVEEATGARQPLAAFGADARPVTEPYSVHLSHLLAVASRTSRKSR